MLAGIGNYVPFAYDGVGDVGPGFPYKVASGDGLSQITWKFGRAAREVVDLYTVNSAIVGGPPSFTLKLGQQLVLPAGWPAKPAKSGSPPRSWAKEALEALKTIGYKPPSETKPPPQVTPAPPPQVTPTPPPPPGPQFQTASVGKLGMLLLGLAGLGIFLGRGKAKRNPRRRRRR